MYGRPSNEDIGAPFAQRTIGHAVTDWAPPTLSERRSNTPSNEDADASFMQWIHEAMINDDGNTRPGAVRVPGIDAIGDESDDDDNLSYDTDSVAHPSNATVATETPFASEVAPDVARLEAELEERLRRLGRNIVQADEVISVHPESSQTVTNCCIIM